MNHGEAFSGNGSALPVFSMDVPHANDYVVGESNTRSLDFERDKEHYIHIPDARGLDFGNAPFTIEAWVKLKSMPSGVNLASVMPVAMKKVIGVSDASLDYMFLATAGTYGTAATYGNLALVLGSTTVVSTLAIPDTGWHYISVSLDPVGNTVRFALDDQTGISESSANGRANSGPLIIGAHFDTSGVIDCAFDGLIDELSITDGFLAHGEMQPLMDRPPPTNGRPR
jgi:hypothetical protein